MKVGSGIITVATAAARDAGRLITQSISKLDRVKVTDKSVPGSHQEWVSDVDTQAEEIIISQLNESFPDFSVLSEEAGLLDKDSEFCWIIDPLDGTHNFLHGHPHFAVSIALKQRDDIVAGVVYDPLRNELFTALKGSGAQLDERRIRVSTNYRLQHALLSTGFPYQGGEQAKPWLKSFATVLPRAQSIHRNGASVLDLAYVACGRYDGFWQFGLKPWDIAAASLLVSEAGGLVSAIGGEKNILEADGIIAGNPKIHEKLSYLIGNTK